MCRVLDDARRNLRAEVRAVPLYLSALFSCGFLFPLVLTPLASVGLYAYLCARVCRVHFSTWRMCAADEHRSRPTSVVMAVHLNVPV